MRKSLLVTLCLVLFPFLLSSCAQWWQVRPYTDFVSAEIVPGDKLRIETRDGTRVKLVVVQIRDDRIIGENQTVMLGDIVELEKYSKVPPANPCSPKLPLGCSVPQWATVLSESQARYAEFFYPSCEQHDYCYRHGAATYGTDRDSCDFRFLNDMQAQCMPDRFTQLLLEMDINYAECNVIAMEFYQVVKKYGVNRFSFTSSSYCEYDGPP